MAESDKGYRTKSGKVLTESDRRRPHRSGATRRGGCPPGHLGLRPRRGDIWLVDSGDPIGGEKVGLRPAVIVSTDYLNQGPAGGFGSAGSLPI